MKKLLTVIGTRPQFIKYAAIAEQLTGLFDHRVVDTGQHYDHALSGAFLSEFRLPPPDYVIGSIDGHPLVQIARIVEKLHSILDEWQPGLVVCFGDTTSTLAAALAAIKHGLPLCHIEAGERNLTAHGNRVPTVSIPEETNRVLVDHASTLLLCASRRALAHLQQESVTGACHFTGDILYDLFLHGKDAGETSTDLLGSLRLEPRGYYFATVHRAVNTDRADRLEAILRACSRCDLPVLLPLHPRTKKMMRHFGLDEAFRADPNIRFLPPISHADSLHCCKHAKTVLTDSGGVMREAFFQKVPSVCLDDSTAWFDICLSGWSTLAGADEQAIVDALSLVPPAEHPMLFGDGNAVRRTLEILRDFSETS